MSEKTIKDGGPAFPSKRVEQRHFDNDPRWDMVNVDVYELGLSLRDYFAAKAMAGMLQYDATGLQAGHVPKRLAQDCYAIADAMLRARDLSTTSDT